MGNGGVLTIGNNMIVSNMKVSDLTSSPSLWRHEYNHSIQYSYLGPYGFGLIWGTGIAVSAASNNMGPGGGGCLNLLEWLAGFGGTTYASGCS